MNTNKKHTKTGFKTPKDYFDTFENNIYEQLEIQPKTGFKTPDNYFDTLEESILNKASSSETKVRRLISRKQITYISTIAATLVFSFLIFKPSDIQNTTFENIEYTVYEEYLSTEHIDMSPYELAELYNINSNDLDDISFSTLEEDNIMNYLTDEIDSEDYFDNDL